MEAAGSCLDASPSSSTQCQHRQRLLFTSNQGHWSAQLRGVWSLANQACWARVRFHFLELLRFTCPHIAVTVARVGWNI